MDHNNICSYCLGTGHTRYHNEECIYCEGTGLKDNDSRPKHIGTNFTPDYNSMEYKKYYRNG